MINRAYEIEKEAVKNFDIVDGGGELTVPLATLNSFTNFSNRYKKKNVGKSIPKICIICGGGFLTDNRASQQMCSDECREIRHKEITKAYRESQAYKDFRAKQKKRYAESPELRKREANIYKKYASKPEVKARQKAYYLARKDDPEVKAKQKAAYLRRKDDPETKVKQKAYYLKQKARLAGEQI